MIDWNNEATQQIRGKSRPHCLRHPHTVRKHTNANPCTQVCARIKGKRGAVNPPNPPLSLHANTHRNGQTQTTSHLFCSATPQSQGTATKKTRFYVAQKRRWPSWFASNLPCLRHQLISRSIFKTSCART